MENMTVDNVMYNFQHKLLPEWFFGNPKEFIGVICQDKSSLFSILNELFERAEVDNPYKPGHFSVDPDMVSDTVGMIKIKFPKPENEPLCHSIVCFFDKTFKYLGFFTFEKGGEMDENFPIMCTWSSEGEHFSYGKVSPDPDEQLIECIDVYMNKYTDTLNAEKKDN